MQQVPPVDALADRPRNPLADPTPLTVCPKCNSTSYHDREIHNGQSQMRECTRCGYSMGIVKWYGIWHGQPAQPQHVATNPAPLASDGPGGDLR